MLLLRGGYEKNIRVFNAYPSTQWAAVRTNLLLMRVAPQCGLPPANTPLRTIAAVHGHSFTPPPGTVNGTFPHSIRGNT